MLGQARFFFSSAVRAAMDKDDRSAHAAESTSRPASAIDWAPMSTAPAAAPCSPSGSDEADEARILLQLAQAPVDPVKPSPARQQPALLQLHACNNCQRAKTACNDERPCARCVRLEVRAHSNLELLFRARRSSPELQLRCHSERPIRS